MEHCPFCKAAAYEGATFCVGCGAAKGRRALHAGHFVLATLGGFAWAWLGVYPMAIHAGIAVERINGNVISHSAEPFIPVLLSIIVTVAGIWCHVRTMRRVREAVWDRRL